MPRLIVLAAAAAAAALVFLQGCGGTATSYVERAVSPDGTLVLRVESLSAGGGLGGEVTDLYLAPSGNAKHKVSVGTRMHSGSIVGQRWTGPAAVEIGLDDASPGFPLSVEVDGRRVAITTVDYARCDPAEPVRLRSTLTMAVRVRVQGCFGQSRLLTIEARSLVPPPAGSRDTPRWVRLTQQPIDEQGEVSVEIDDNVVRVVAPHRYPGGAGTWSTDLNVGEPVTVQWR